MIILFTKFILLIEPLEVRGEGNYGLAVVKEIDGTEAFLGLDTNTRKCQNEESLGDCLAKDFLKSGMELCNCTPYMIRNYSKEVRDHDILILYT